MNAHNVGLQKDTGIIPPVAIDMLHKANETMIDRCKVA